MFTCVCTGLCVWSPETDVRNFYQSYVLSFEAWSCISTVCMDDKVSLWGYAVSAFFVPELQMDFHVHLILMLTLNIWTPVFSLVQQDCEMCKHLSSPQSVRITLSSSQSLRSTLPNPLSVRITLPRPQSASFFFFFN